MYNIYISSIYASCYIIKRRKFMKNKLSFISTLLAICMLLALFASCSSGNKAAESTQGTATSGTSAESTAETEKETSQNTSAPTTDDSTTEGSHETTSNDSDEASTEGSEETTTESTAESTAESTVESTADTEIELEGVYADSLIYADEIKNGVQAYYPDGVARDDYVIENLNMTAEFGLAPGKDPMLTHLKNKQGGTYLENTMDVFIRMKNGNTYYSSDSYLAARSNTYRIGYYYYDVRILNQTFLSNSSIASELPMDVELFKYYNANSISMFGTKKNSVVYKVSGGDPYFSCKGGDLDVSFEEYDALQLTVKSSYATDAQVFFQTDEKPKFSADQSITFKVKNDGEFHTYTVMLDELPNTKGKITAFRFDLGKKLDEVIEVKDMKMIKLETESPYILLDRTLHTYSDKLHQELHFVAPAGQDNIDALGMITQIPEERVEKIIAKSNGAIQTELKDVDFSTIEYIGFDIKDAGIFGYIMPCDDGSGSLSVTLENGVYTIIQEACPENGTISSPKEVGDTSNDFFMGQRLYTDASHEFDEFLKEAEFERNPMKGVTSDNYLQYEPLRGAYRFTIGGTSFNPPFFSSWNKHFSTDIIVRNKDDVARNIYIRTTTSSGCLESAVLLDHEGLIIPIPLEVSKNFGEKEEPVMNFGDVPYGETLFPLVANQNVKYSFTVLNLYQNWGRFPLKQLSSIAYYAPYYHLSIGTTETTCISPWYVRGRSLWTLPDFRSISAPYWFELPTGAGFDNQPQHTSSDLFEIFHYIDPEGNFIAGENYKNVIDSSGPVYAEVTMDYLSDNGKMNISYNHIELPQTDELRTFYQVRFDILEDMKVNDFKNDFAFYSWETVRTHVGYLNAEDQTVNEESSSYESEYILGKTSPYFGCYGTSSNNAANIGFVIHSSDITVGGEKFDGNFVVVKSSGKRFELSLDLGEVTFKAGDTMILNIILIPWGSHLSTDASNLEKIRENTCIDPFTTTVTDGELIPNPYMPKIRSTNGKSAEFTVSGGANNAAIRVYGFEKLTAPKIYEKIGEEWVPYDVSSANFPDATGNRHYYDGYSTYYDGDGTYSYAFAISMDDCDSRTFRISAEDDFKEWPKLDILNNDPINYYTDPNELKNLFQNPIPGVSSAEVIENEEDVTFIRITGDGNNIPEVSLDIYTPIDGLASGQYIVLKYRIPTTNSVFGAIEFFASTVYDSARGTDSIWIPSSRYTADGNWQVVILDASTFKPDTFKANDSGEYFCNYIRFDVFNAPMSTEDYIDVAYVGICDTVEELRELNKDFESLTLLSKDKTERVNVETGETTVIWQNNAPVVPEVSDTVTMSRDAAEFIAADNTNGYTASSAPYFGRIDVICGYGPEGVVGTSYNFKGSSSSEGIATFKYDGKTTSDLYLVISGWSLVHGGIEKYVWSADGGKTWHDIELYGLTKISTAGASMVGYANDKCGKSDFDLYAEKSSYQGSLAGHSTCNGLGANLSEFEGETVSVTFAAVPATDTNSLCILAHITGVKVEDPSDAGEDDETDTETETETNTETEPPVVEEPNPYNDPINYYMDANEMHESLKNSIPAGVSSLELDEDGEYLRFYGDGSGADEAVFYAYSSSKKIATGQYIVVKYRMPSTNTEANYLQIFASTVHKAADAADSIYLSSTTKVKDDAWHVIVIDAASFLSANYAPEGGKYYCNYIRFDVFNVAMSQTSYIDIAYIGIGDDLDKIRQLDANAELDTLMLVTKEQNQYIKVDSGEIVDNPDGSRNPKITYVSGGAQFVDMNNAQGYIASDAHYYSRVDSLNGLGPAGSTTSAYDMGSNDKNGIACIEYDFTTTDDKKFAMAGWSLVYGGIEKYVWSADGGKTWNDVIYVGRSSAATASDGMLSFCSLKYGSDVDFSPYKANSSYQGGSLGTPAGIGADLSAFAGQTVDLTFAAVSAEDTDSLCILIHIKGIKVAESFRNQSNYLI